MIAMYVGRSGMTYELAHLNFNGTFQAAEISITYDVIALWSFLTDTLWPWQRATELDFIAGNNAVWILRRSPHHYIGEHPDIPRCTRYCVCEGESKGEQMWNAWNVCRGSVNMPYPLALINLNMTLIN